MPQDDAHELLSNILDRCAAMERPFWEVSAEKRAEVARNFGSPAVIMRVGQGSDEDLRIAGGADLRVLRGERGAGLDRDELRRALGSVPHSACA